MADRKLLSEWITANKDKVVKGGDDALPTSKQISFAEKLAKNKGMKIPIDTLKSRSLLSVWLNTNAPQ